jgi:hypothetical protein
VTFVIDETPAAGDILAGRIDPAGELGKRGVDAGIDDGDLDPLARPAGIISRDRP